jgi:hypothetical protein
MTSVPTTQSAAPSTAAAEGDRDPIRLRLKPNAAPTGYVDGAWWPRSRDLSSELPSLLAELAVRLGRIERVSYNLTAWGPTVRKINYRGFWVRLAGYRSQHKDTIDVLGARERVTLLVVPPESSPQAADHALTTAGSLGNTDGIAELLAFPATPTVHPGNGQEQEEQAAEQRL